MPLPIHRWLDQQRARFRYRQAQAHQRKGNLTSALIALNQALDGYPAPAHIYVEMGIVHWQGGDPLAALTAFDQAIALDPTQVRAYGNRGLLHYQQGCPTQALDDWNQALRHQPNHPLIHYNRGLLYLHQGDYTAALAAFDQAIAADPNRAEAYLHRGNVHERLGNQAQAAQDWELALCNDLNLDQARLKLNEIQQANGDRALSQRLHQALALDEITVIACHQPNEITIDLIRPLGVGLNYFSLPDKIRQILIAWQTFEIQKFQLTVRVQNPDSRDVVEWQGQYNLFQGQPCPPAQWRRVLLTAFVIFPPLGIPALVYALTLKQAYQRGDYPTALRASKAIQGLCRTGGVISLVLVTLGAGYWGYQQLDDIRARELPRHTTLSPQTRVSPPTDRHG